MTPTECAAAERWAALVQYAAARGLSENALRQMILRPCHRGGYGWKWWAVRMTTPELAEALRRRVDEMTINK